ncbi:MAG: SRPBCC family protein [Erythrobacter sp.]
MRVSSTSGPGLALAATAVAMAAAVPAAAEVSKTHASGFVVRHEVMVEADTKATWLALISPDTWWQEEHTWSGDSANLSLTPSAGGCFCERIPEVDEPGRFTLEGSVEHMRVIQSYPETALRMLGALGPLQSEPVTGVLTIAISKAEEGTRLVWEYNVAGYMRYELPVIARAVDGVIGLQAQALADLLGRVGAPTASDPENKPDETVPAEVSPEKPVARPVPGKSPPPAKPKVDEAFGDLSDE